MLCVRGYIEFNGEAAKKIIRYINKGIKFIGCSSHQSFPRYCVIHMDIVTMKQILKYLVKI